MLLAAHLSAPTLRAGTIACAPWRSNRMVIFRLDKTRVGAEIQIAATGVAAPLLVLLQIDCT